MENRMEEKYRTIENVIIDANNQGVSDIHICCGLPIKVRLDGQLVSFSEGVLTDEICEDYARQMAGPRFKEIQDIGEIDLASSYQGIRVRLNIYKQQGHFSAAIRILSNRIPNLENLGLPEPVFDFPKMQRGIVLVTGETGSGKSTTLAALVDRINHTRNEHIITIEDPIEYIYTPDKCVINQREIGRDTETYANGLRAILREDPDIILIGEMRDLTTIEAALTAAETGHLVFGTLHTKSAADSIDRMVEVFPSGAQKQIRMQVSTCLNAVLSQQLVARDGGGRVLACELMMVTPAIRNLIREAKTPQIASAMSTNKDIGSQTMDNALIELVRDSYIDKATAIAAAHDVEYVKQMT